MNSYALLLITDYTQANTLAIMIYFRLNSILAAKSFVLQNNKTYNNKFSFKSKSVSDIQVGDNIHIEVIKGFVSDDIGEKYLVTSIDKDNKILYVDGDSILDSYSPSFF